MKKTLTKATLLAAAASMLASVTACGPAPMLPQSQMGFNPAQRGALNSFSVLPSNRAGKKWTIAIQLAADNNLYRAGLDDLNEMEAGLAQNPAAAEQLDVIVLFDGLPQGDSKIYRIKPDPNGYDDKIVSEVIDDQGAVIPTNTHEVDSGSPETLARFTDFVTKNFPAEHNSMEIWNHGSGIFRSNPSGDPSLGGTSFFETIGNQAAGTRGDLSKSFAVDDHGSMMGLKDLNPAMEIANRNLGKAMDIFGFDTCLMQHVETAYQLKGQVNFLVASEQLEPGDGWDYVGYIGAAAKNPNISPRDLAYAIVDAYGKSYSPGGSQHGRDVTLAALDINQVANVLTPAINQFGDALAANLSSDKAAIDAARSRTQMFYNRDAADLGDFLKNIAQTSHNSAILGAANQVQQAIAQTVVNEAHVGSGVDHATGVQTYFPPSSYSYNRRYDDPADIRFAETQHWGNFLKAYTGK